MDILKKNLDITNLSNFKTRAFTRYYFELNYINDVDKIIDIVKFSKKNHLKILFVWGWTNILFSFEKFDWIVIKNNLNSWIYDKKNQILESLSWNSISDIASILEKDDEQYLWHRFIWLPWSIWWAVFWNAWCFWLETENNFLEAKVLNLDNWKIEYLSKKQMNFSYRSSILKETWKYFLISVKFDLSKKIEKYPQKVDNIFFRENKQPKWNTCWSFFKNPSKDLSAWYLIEQVWLKWFKLWSAYFSDIHANFLMSDDWWNYKDLLELISLAKTKVKKNHNIDLINEIRIITN